MKFLSYVKGLEFIVFLGKYNCCGFGGMFFVKMVQIFEQMVDEKVVCVEEMGVEVLIGVDCGCLMNIGGWFDCKDKNVKVMYIVEVFNSR